MNKVYYFAGKDGDYGGVYIGASNFKEAKNYALDSELLELYDLDNPFVDIRGHVCRRNKEPITTEHEGELTVGQIIEAGLAWWSCECGSDDFTVIQEDIIDPQEYKCNQCGCTSDIPYAGN